MTRPARPGDICVIIKDTLTPGLNVGKQCTCDVQCACYSDSWECTSLEGLIVTSILGLFRCQPGQVFCIQKPDIIPLLDPENEDVRTETETPATSDR